jgi:putative transposase
VAGQRAREKARAFANRIVGWATDPRATTTLVLTALNHALRSRDVRAGS